MRIFGYIRRLPQPIKTLYVLWILFLAVAFIGFFARAGGWAFVPLGVDAVLVGLTCLFDFRGNATAVADEMKRRRPMGVDYSRSFLATTAYARVFGAFAIVVGVGFVAQALTRH